MTEKQPSRNIIQSDMKQQFESFLEQYFTNSHRERCYPGLIFQHGKRTMLQINVPAKHLPNLLQAKPATANNPDSGKDRPEIKGHAEEIKQYIVERASNGKPWILGTLTANVSPERITIIELGCGFCIVVISQGVKLDLTDGQHRTKAIQDLLKENERDYIINDCLPITLILEDNFSQCQSDFRDLAQSKPVDKSLLLSFEDSVRAEITKNLIEQVHIFSHKTDKFNKSPSKKEKLIYTSNYIARAVSCAFTDNAEDDLKNYPIEESSKILTECLNQFFSECLQTRHICETKIEKLTLTTVNIFRDECLLGVSVGLEILGRLLYCAYDPKSHSFISKKVSQLAQLDWSRENSLWHNNIVRINPKSKNPTKTIAWGAGALADAVKMAKAELKWM